ncbi:STAS domain-containing protein [Pleionea sp. CnH1-48]|uniref:STAS domain-containing protein n=1 Tax=Pleionea sp. CnH1-48 TaxID=2954494 RepID=UPI002096EF2C|nr:STAS domain-containing protein [Pleionea sp. CnH1-48]MCO7222840.1 STAS domain-containing protein [Pleionea sp. CnH1-48]
MSYQVAQNGEETVVFLDGDVDLERSPSARKVLLEWVEKGQNVVVDMSEVSYIDSSGVASLVEALQASKKNNVDFYLKQVSEPALKVFKLARLEKVFNIIEG